MNSAHCLVTYPSSRGGFDLEVPSFEFPSGSATALVGRSGSGKTTLINGLLGLIGVCTFSGTVPQFAAVLHHTLALRWLLLSQVVSLESEARSRPIDLKVLLHHMSFLQLDESVLDKRVWEISHGMRQRFEIAKALAVNPDLILFDEACSGIDAGIKPRVFELLNVHLKTHECALVFVTHDFGEVARLSDRVIVLDKGRIVDSFDVEESREERLSMDPVDLLHLNVSKALVAAIY
jgi:ABC-type multidrug transport system ATPase subunit